MNASMREARRGFPQGTEVHSLMSTSISRRSFLKGTLGGAAGLAAMGVIGMGAAASAESAAAPLFKAGTY